MIIKGQSTLVSPDAYILYFGDLSARGTSIAEACSRSVKVISSTLPQPSAIASYRKAYRLYGEFYPLLKPSFEKMAA